MCRCPDVLHNIAVDNDVIGILELKEIFYDPLAPPPGSPLVEVVAFDGDIARHQIQDLWILTADHNVLAGTFQKIVLNEKRTRTVPAHDRLRIGIRILEIVEVRIDYADICAVGRDAAA